MYSIKKYDRSHYALWNDFVQKSKNGTFLFHRDFMEYHADRFEDHSLIVFDDDKPVALLPANRVGDVVFSHQGLTYGGVVMADTVNFERTEQIFNSVCNFLREEGINILKLGLIPSFYHKLPSFEPDNILFRYGATLYRRDMVLAINYSRPLNISKSKLKHFRRVSGIGLEIRQDNDFAAFWKQVLVPRLSEKHNAKPVHTLEEITLLHSRFPEAIQQYNVYYEDNVVAGITLFNFGHVVKSQYGAATAEGEKMRALDFLFITLINEFRQKAGFFDMGTVSSAEGKAYSSGMLKQKEELGCKVYCQDFYEVETTAYGLLDNVIL